MDINSYTQLRILFGKVMHKRFIPKPNHFNYAIYYLAIPINALKRLPSSLFFGINRFGLMSFHECDHGRRDGTDLKQ